MAARTTLQPNELPPTGRGKVCFDRHLTQNVADSAHQDLLRPQHPAAVMDGCAPRAASKSWPSPRIRPARPPTSARGRWTMWEISRGHGVRGPRRCGRIRGAAAVRKAARHGSQPYRTCAAATAARTHRWRRRWLAVMTPPAGRCPRRVGGSWSCEVDALEEKSLPGTARRGFSDRPAGRRPALAGRGRPDPTAIPWRRQARACRAWCGDAAVADRRRAGQIGRLTRGRRRRGRGRLVLAQRTATT